MAESPTTARRRTALLATGVVGTLLGLSVVAVPAASASPGAACANRPNTTYAMLLECVTLDGVRAHQAALQAIADNNSDEFYPGSRAAGTAGYADSAAYVADLLRGAGYQVTLDEFEFEFRFPAGLQRISPNPATYETGAFTNSGSGIATGLVVPVDVMIPSPGGSTSGCEAADFAGFPAGAIALVQRGTCAFAVKAANAQAAGATAVIIFNEGNSPDREGLIVGTLDPFVATIPVVGASFNVGASFAQLNATGQVRVLPSETRTDVNVIAELPGTNRNNVVMAGAHLDSVGKGPGINDNGSGSAALLEVALKMAKMKPVNTLRFAWWGAEEHGLLGSEAYVAGLSPAELDRIALYMNYDMIGSPNYVFMVYDADESSFPAPVVVPPGSTAIEDVYESYFTMIGEPYDDAEFSGRSDYQAFILAGIPSGGLFTGAEEVKTAEQQSIWGGTAGAQFDPCYHLACDTLANNSNHALEVNTDLIAYAMLTFAYSTQPVNGVAGKRVPGPASLPAPAGAGAEGTFVEGSGGHALLPTA